MEVRGPTTLRRRRGWSWLSGRGQLTWAHVGREPVPGRGTGKSLSCRGKRGLTLLPALGNA